MQRAHTIVKGNTTIRIMDYAKTGYNVEVGSKENNLACYLKIKTSAKPVKKDVIHNVIKPEYPAAPQNEKLLDDWLAANPMPEGYWMSDIWKDYLKQDGKSRLMDFSYAGYHDGEKEIPHVETILGKVTDFGAIPNDGKDDTEAIQHAIDELSGNEGVILFPKGRYIVNGDPSNPKQLFLNANNIVLRGEGSGEDGTVINMVNKFLPEKGYGDFILEVGKQKPGTPYAGTAITSESKIGDKIIKVHSTEKLKEGAYMKIIFNVEMKDGEKTQDLPRTLTYPLEPNDTWFNFTRSRSYESINQIARIIDETTIELKQPLRKNISLRWKPQLRSVAFYQEVGIENMRFKGEWHGEYWHHKDREADYGWCAIRFANVANGWVKDVHIEDMTYDITFNNVKNITASNISNSGNDGHHGLVGSSAHDILIKDVVMNAHRTHNIGGGGKMEGCVWSNITINDPRGQVDFHGGGFPSCNLFDNIKGVSVAGAGANQNMPHAGRDNTFYNITGKEKSKRTLLQDEFFPEGVWNYHENIQNRNGKFAFDCYKLYPGSVVIGIYKPKGTMKIDKSTADRDNDFIYVEGLNKPNIWPVSLYEAQKEIRLNK